LKIQAEFFKLEVPNLQWRGQEAAVTVETAETVGENEYSIPPKDKKKRVVKCFEVKRRNRKWYFSRMAIRDSQSLECTRNTFFLQGYRRLPLTPTCKRNKTLFEIVNV